LPDPSQPARAATIGTGPAPAPALAIGSDLADRAIPAAVGRRRLGRVLVVGVLDVDGWAGHPVGGVAGGLRLRSGRLADVVGFVRFTLGPAVLMRALDGGLQLAQRPPQVWASELLERLGGVVLVRPPAGLRPLALGNNETEAYCWAEITTSARPQRSLFCL
jgi:hypothetical protein